MKEGNKCIIHPQKRSILKLKWIKEKERQKGRKTKNENCTN